MKWVEYDSYLQNIQIIMVINWYGDYTIGKKNVSS